MKKLMLAIVLMGMVGQANAFGILTCQNTRTLDVQEFPGRFSCPPGWVRIYY